LPPNRTPIDNANAIKIWVALIFPHLFFPAYNLGVIMRQLFKIGTARSPQGMSWAGMLAVLAALWSFVSLFPTSRRYRLSLNRKYRPAKYIFAGHPLMNWNPRNRHYSTGC
jgi:hypothetical protein